MGIRSHYLLWRQQMVVWIELILVIHIILEPITNEVLNYWKHPSYLLNTLLNWAGKNKGLEHILIPLLRPGQKWAGVSTNAQRKGVLWDTGFQLLRETLRGGAADLPGWLDLECILDRYPSLPKMGGYWPIIQSQYQFVFNENGKWSWQWKWNWGKYGDTIQGRCLITSILKMPAF